jgi:hypothetical protein
VRTRHELDVARKRCGRHPTNRAESVTLYYRKDLFFNEGTAISLLAIHDDVVHANRQIARKRSRHVETTVGLHGGRTNLCRCRVNVDGDISIWLETLALDRELTVLNRNTWRTTERSLMAAPLSSSLTS